MANIKGQKNYIYNFSYYYLLLCNSYYRKYRNINHSNGYHVKCIL